MSRDSQAKKARRRKRRESAAGRWLPDAVLDAVDDQADAMADDIVDAAEQFGDWLTGRGWAFDVDGAADGVVSWYFEPSAVEPETDEHEVVTRVLLTVLGEEDDFPHRVIVVLAGSGPDDPVYSVAPDLLVDRVVEVEGYRPGGPQPGWE